MDGQTLYERVRELGLVSYTWSYLSADSRSRWETFASRLGATLTALADPGVIGRLSAVEQLVQVACTKLDRLATAVDTIQIWGEQMSQEVQSLKAEVEKLVSASAAVAEAYKRLKESQKETEEDKAALASISASVTAATATLAEALA